MSTNNEELIYIYIVDVDEYQQKKLRSKFTEANTEYILRPYSSGEKFMDNLLLNPPPKKALSIVIVDYNINQNNKQAMNGMNVLYKTKEQHPEFNVIVISESSDNFESIKTEALNAGATAFFKKNDNVYLRVRNIIKGMISKNYLSKKKKVSHNAIIAFIIVLFGVSTLFFLLFKLFPKLFYF